MRGKNRKKIKKKSNNIYTIIKEQKKKIPTTFIQSLKNKKIKNKSQQHLYNH
jgi:hypothetical protein